MCCVALRRCMILACGYLSGNLSVCPLQYSSRLLVADLRPDAATAKSNCTGLLSTAVASIDLKGLRGAELTLFTIAIPTRCQKKK